ncbi:MAG: response regulator transcription factor [Comamonadaceae bacterium]|nr:MAG: response regulator transcription factor [Comamonadaceae bacterium]
MNGSIPACVGGGAATPTFKMATGAAFSASMWPHFLTGQPDQPVRVLLIDDDPHIRRVIAQDLTSDLRVSLQGQAASVREGQRLIARHTFDVVLIDLNLPDGSGFQLIEFMKTANPKAEAVVVSAFEDEERAMHAFELGASGYLVKNSWFGSFAQAVLQVVNGGAAITPNLARRLLNRFEPPARCERSGARAPGVTAAEGCDKLSEREREILQLVASGHTSAEIGRRLMVSMQTVNTHIKNIYRKLHVRTRAQAVNLASRRNWML